MLPKIVNGWTLTRDDFYHKYGFGENGVLWISGETSKIDDVREWLNFCKNVVNDSSSWAMVIEKADKLSADSQSILLKPLEEKSFATPFFLLTENASFLLPTILSRCEIVSVKKVSKESVYWREVVSLWKKGPGEIVKFSESFNQDNLEELLKEILKKVKQEMYNSVNLKRIAIAKVVLQTIKQVTKTNVNKRLALESFLLTTWRMIKDPPTTSSLGGQA